MGLLAFLLAQSPLIDARELRSQDAGDTSTSSELLGKTQVLV